MNGAGLRATVHADRNGMPLVIVNDKRPTQRRIVESRLMPGSHAGTEGWHARWNREILALINVSRAGLRNCVRIFGLDTLDIDCLSVGRSRVR